MKGNTMEKLSYDLKVEYGHELNSIHNILKQLSDGNVYEISRVKMDGSLAHNVDRLETELAQLLNKIQNGEEGFVKRAAKYIV